jgi:hypothetical protein
LFILKNNNKTFKKGDALVVKLVDTKDIKGGGFTFTTISDSLR